MGTRCEDTEQGPDERRLPGLLQGGGGENRCGAKPRRRKTGEGVLGGWWIMTKGRWGVSWGRSVGDFACWALVGREISRMGGLFVLHDFAGLCD